MRKDTRLRKEVAKGFRGFSEQWLGSVLPSCEEDFRRIKGYEAIAEVVAAIDAEQKESPEAERRAA